MRSRTMLKRLDRIAPAQPEEMQDRNLSVLTPWEYDRFRDLSTARSLTTAEFQEAEALWGKCPIQTDNGRRAPIEISRSLEDYWKLFSGSGWRPYSFRQLRMVERQRFLELCAQYGWEAGAGHLRSRMVPLSQWRADEQAEMRALLDLADSNKRQRSSPWGAIQSDRTR